ncbi:MAG: universal stress protein [Flavobacteriales bacterium]
MKKLLVPTDFSTFSLNALGVAADIAKKAKAEVILLHIVDYPIAAHHLEDFLETETGKELTKKINQQFLEVLQLKSMQGVNISTHVHYNSMIKGIHHFADKEKVDVIVMGSHGHNKMNDYVFGSNTEKLLRLTDYPLIIVKEAIVEYSINTLVFCSDFSETSVKSFEKIKPLIEVFHPEIHLLKVITRGNFDTSKNTNMLMNNFAKNAHMSGFYSDIITAESVEEGIADYCSEVKPELLVMETHGRTGVAHMVLGSIAENVINKTKQPVLSLRVGYPEI